LGLALKALAHTLVVALMVQIHTYSDQALIYCELVVALVVKATQALSQDLVEREEVKELTLAATEEQAATVLAEDIKLAVVAELEVILVTEERADMDHLLLEQMALEALGAVALKP